MADISFLPPLYDPTEATKKIAERQARIFNLTNSIMSTSDEMNKHAATLGILTANDYSIKSSDVPILYGKVANKKEVYDAQYKSTINGSIGNIKLIEAVAKPGEEIHGPIIYFDAKFYPGSGMDSIDAKIQYKLSIYKTTFSSDGMWWGLVKNTFSDEINVDELWVSFDLFDTINRNNSNDIWNKYEANTAHIKNPIEELKKATDELINPTNPIPPDDSSRDYSKTLEYQMQEEFTNPNYNELAKYYGALYGKWDAFTMQSFNAVIGLPFNFMKNVDPCVGSSSYGKQYIEDILYDMPIALLRPGGPYLNSGLFDNGGSGLINFIKTGISYYGEYMKGSGFKEMLIGEDEKFTFYGSNGKAIEEGVSYSDLESKSNSGESDLGILEQMMLNIFVGKYTRFYTFMADFTKYTQYVNTLCHLFIHFLGIGNMYYIRADGQAALYAYYQDTWEQGETDKGNTLKHLFGPNHAIYAYYQPESNLSQVYSNTMRPTALESTLTSASDISKDAHFFLSSSKIDDLSMDLSKALNAVGSNGSGILGRLFGNVAEGAATILAGNNLDLPEVWADSQAQTTHTLTFRLTSPYGDRESIFLYVLRPLARLLAMSLPRQFGPNSYTSPFLVQAFSKGQFNIQCGVVTSLSVKRCGNGGESHTIMNIPTDLEVTMEIQDMYELVTLSNEYAGHGVWNSAFDLLGDKIGANINIFGTVQATKLMFNNIGLMDFCAAYCGMNMNMPEQDMMMTLLFDVFKNRKADTVGEGVIGVTGVKSPSWTRQLQDNYYNAVGKNQTFITG